MIQLLTMKNFTVYTWICSKMQPQQPIALRLMSVIDIVVTPVLFSTFGWLAAENATQTFKFADPRTGPPRRYSTSQDLTTH